jgi:hypothetical protein
VDDNLGNNIKELESCFPQITRINTDLDDAICENLPAGRQVSETSGKKETHNSLFHQVRSNNRDIIKCGWIIMR